jgi:hypothetical protein
VSGDTDGGVSFIVARLVDVRQDGIQRRVSHNITIP